jgi:hypothetical protein
LVQVIPQGGALAVECADGTRVREVSYATWGTPLLHPNGSVTTDLRCHSPGALTIVRNACEGQSHCCLPIADQNFRRDPCVGKVKTFAVELRGCAQHIPESKYKTHCALLGQPLLVNEDVEFLAALELPPAPEPVGPWVAAMVDTSFRPELQHFVVHNVHNNTGWPIQLFTGPTSKPKLELLFQDLISRGQMTLTSIGDDYMEASARPSPSAAPLFDALALTLALTLMLTLLSARLHSQLSSPAPPCPHEPLLLLLPFQPPDPLPCRTGSASPP